MSGPSGCAPPAVEFGGDHRGSINCPDRCNANRACLEFLSALTLSQRDPWIAERVLKEVNERLAFLVDVGPPPDPRSRGRNVGWWRGQRIRLATQIGSGLVGVLYVLDEPEYWPAS